MSELTTKLKNELNRMRGMGVQGKTFDFGSLVEIYDTLLKELHDDHATFRTNALNTETLIEELHDDHATLKTVIDELVTKINSIVSQFKTNSVVGSSNGSGGAGLAIHGASTENAKCTYAIAVTYKGAVIPVAIDAEIDISALTGGGDTIAQDKHGVLAVYAKTDGTIDVESVKATADFASLIAALAEYSHSTNISTYLGANEVVPIGFIHVEEDDSGAFTWGTDALSGETANNYYSFQGYPGILTKLGSLALVASASTFSYGVGVVTLGNGARIALTGEATVASEVGTAVADGTVGCWVIYALADDSVISKQLSHDYADKATADAAVRDMVPNPLLPIVGWFTVENGSGADWTMGTENFDDTDITATFNIVGTGADWKEIGRATLGQPFQVMQNAAPGTLTAPKPASPPATLSASKPS